MRMLERFRLVAPEDPYVDIAYVVPWRGEIGEESFPAAGSHDRRCKLSEIAGHRHPTSEELKKSEQVYEDWRRKDAAGLMNIELGMAA